METFFSSKNFRKKYFLFFCEFFFQKFFFFFSYTHFTSPIRRYPDIIVHRLLAASLNYTADPGYSVKQLNGIAMRANSTKACAKMCSETSADIFFGSFIRVRK